MARLAAGRQHPVADALQPGDAVELLLGKWLVQGLGRDVIVFGSPVYKASYTGVLKAFCDHILAGQLSGKVGIPLMVGGSLQHFLALEVHLRPLLVELGALCPTPGPYVVETELDQLDSQLASYVTALRPSLQQFRSR